MAKRKVHEVDQRERHSMLNDFFRMIAKLKTQKDAANFFRDLLTPSESLMLIRRIEIAKMLLEGWNFEEIRGKLKVGYNTINGVNRWLYSGFGGYLKELQQFKSKKEFQRQIAKNEWQRIKRKYPAHFLIIP